MDTELRTSIRPKILLADDHTLVLEGLSKLLQNEFDLVGTARSGAEAVEMAGTLNPDVVLIDISMPGLNGFDATVRLKQQVPNMKVVAVTMHQSTDYWKESIRAGMVGFVSKQSAASELAAAVQAVMRNERYVSPLVKQKLEEETPDPALSERQRQVLRLIARGCIAKEIGTRLQISVRTAEFHRVSIMQKLGLYSTAELTRYALEHGIAD